MLKMLTRKPRDIANERVRLIWASSNGLGHAWVFGGNGGTVCGLSIDQEPMEYGEPSCRICVQVGRQIEGG